MSLTIESGPTTPADLETGLAEMLCSRLCHDLVSPIGAIANGAELLEEDGPAGGLDPDMGGEALRLIADSATQAAARLRLFRLAYGAAGNVTALAESELRAVLAGWFHGGRVRVDWPAGLGLPERPGLPKLLLNAALLAEECLPLGGAVAFLSTGAAFVVRAQGRGATLRPESRALLDDPRAPLTARSVQALYTQVCAGKIGAGFAVLSGNPDMVDFAFTF